MLWYNRPANKWDEALPIGNGSLGGMIFGNINKEYIQLNEESL
ncbi:MAG: glycoside hydrolase N-terminal domain-containing protein [Cellulosilyticum sp.]|nr:glycoside hydrolase N-terminal domain-containing protein [Cellulosilyticum sp.]